MPKTIHRTRTHGTSPQRPFTGDNQRQDLLSRTFTNQYKIPVSRGSLFYPCCGSDTNDPLMFFLDVIDEFHFAERHKRCFGLPILAVELEEKVRNNERLPDNLPNLISPRRSGWYPSNIVTSTKKTIDSDTLASYEWTIKNFHTIKIFCHFRDAFEVFQELDMLSVFFYRNDSSGEGGSGVWWLGERLFNMIIDKLVDGALIITDGSNPGLYPDRVDVPWKNLWRYSPSNDSPLDNSGDFIYRDRMFKYIGKIGQPRSTPVWQVKKL